MRSGASELIYRHCRNDYHIMILTEMTLQTEAGGEVDLEWSLLGLDSWRRRP